MSITTFPPPYVAAAHVPRQLRDAGYAVLDAAELAALVGASATELAALAGAWSDLAPDTYLRDGGRYRRRRHACYVATTALRPVPHRAHWQPLEYNALHGGMRRWFEPVAAEVAGAAGWTRLLLGLGRAFGSVRPAPPGTPWYVEAHQFRIDTAGGIGRPTPEGAHRDGVDFVAVVLVGRQGVKGGETRVFDAVGPAGSRFTMVAPWTALLLDDTRVIHETTPVQPLDEDAAPGARDTLVVTYRSGGFQGGDTS